MTSNDMLDFLLAYNKGLKILDGYDHQSLQEIKGNDSTYIVTHEECKRVIENTVFANKGDLFGIEKDDSFKSSIAIIFLCFIEKIMRYINLTNCEYQIQHLL